MHHRLSNSTNRSLLSHSATASVFLIFSLTPYPNYVRILLAWCARCRWDPWSTWGRWRGHPISDTPGEREQMGRVRVCMHACCVCLYRVPYEHNWLASRSTSMPGETHTHAIAAASISFTCAPSDRMNCRSVAVWSRESLVETTLHATRKRNFPDPWLWLKQARQARQMTTRLSPNYQRTYPCLSPHLLASRGKGGDLKCPMPYSAYVLPEGIRQEWNTHFVLSQTSFRILGESVNKDKVKHEFELFIP